ncbi:uncharacterized protein LOC118766002 [Octopus sinensis]|uniref:Uncharacterized protein LOC118766002 n=1 Tax=Octopus sinensis TaxID=2607531 RepID=A0A7E6FBM5_9MOLL|nr:uncharacterized protein LOC118766002 [Octopus sinensis]
MARRRGEQIGERDRLAILLRYQQIKDGVANETVSDLCNAFQVDRNIPARIYKNATLHGTIQPKQRSGRPSLVKNAALQERMVNAIRERRHPTVQLLLQPPQSSDLNPLEEGIFKVLVDKVELKNPTTRHELHEAVLQSWEELSERKIRGCIQHQTRVRRQIVDCRGGNRFV